MDGHPRKYHLGNRRHSSMCFRRTFSFYRSPTSFSYHQPHQDRGMLVVGRIIAGISVGLASAVVPVYQSEISAPSIRGRLVSVQQWSITWGIMLQYFVQFGCSYINGTASFRIPWGLQMIPAIILGFGMLLFPESPRWLVDHDR